MDTPILDFVERYARGDSVRLHMPGHKGRGPLGCEGLDITEIWGADALYEAGGIIARSEENASALFGSGRTVYSTEGSSQCIRAMLYLALTRRAADSAPVVLAGRNAHKAFLYAAALVGFEVEWLWPEEEGSLCACPITAAGLERALAGLERRPAAVYVTSPDYLGNLLDIGALAETAHRHGTVLLVDNAHGAYLHFLKKPCHPLDLGADLCCDSAHKTLPVLTGGAYLHVGAAAAARWGGELKGAMALFGSTSPSYLILASLDRCNRLLAEEGREAITAAAERTGAARTRLEARGWRFRGDEPLKLTVDAPASGAWGGALARQLRSRGVECEYADEDSLVLMTSVNTTPRDLARLEEALGTPAAPPRPPRALPLPRGERVMTVRQAMLAPHRRIPAGESLGMVCAAPTVSCPPAVPIAVAGEKITPQALELFHAFGVEEVEIVEEENAPQK